MDLDVHKIMSQLQQDEPEKFPRRAEADAPFVATPVVYFCKDCKKIITVDEKLKTKKCPECKGKNVAFGTEKSILNFYDFKLLPKGEE